MQNLRSSRGPEKTDNGFIMTFDRRGNICFEFLLYLVSNAEYFEAVADANFCSQIGFAAFHQVLNVVLVALVIDKMIRSQLNNS